MKTYKYEVILRSQDAPEQVSYKKVFIGECMAHDTDEADKLICKRHNEDLGKYGYYIEINIRDVTDQPRIMYDHCVFWKEECFNENS